MSSVRSRRLAADHEKLAALAAASGGTIAIESSNGRPPDSYTLRYRCRGVAAVAGDSPSYRDTHSLCLELPLGYPIQAPLVRFLTPIFHPHVFPGTHVVCIGTWTINEQLDQLVLRLGALIQYDPQYFNFASPANATAAEWARRHLRRFPVDSVTFRDAVRPDEPIAWRSLP